SLTRQELKRRAKPRTGNDPVDRLVLRYEAQWNLERGDGTKQRIFLRIGSVHDRAYRSQNESQKVIVEAYRLGESAMPFRFFGDLRTRRQEVSGYPDSV